MKKIIVLLLLSVYPASAQTPTVVYGAAETAVGNENQFMVIQPENAPNPLGNPIVTPPDTQTTIPAATSQEIPQQQSTVSTQNKRQPAENVINQTAEQNPEPFSETPQQEQNQIQNTLYQGGNRIYDVQSFPINDIKTITEPNIQPTITTYPEY